MTENNLVVTSTQLETKKEELEMSEELRENIEEKLKTTEDKLEIADNQFQNVKTELQITEKEVARLEDTIEYLENAKPGSSQSSSSTEHIIISLIRRVNGARETDTCLGSSLGSGYITAQYRVLIFSNVYCSAKPSVHVREDQILKYLPEEDIFVCEFFFNIPDIICYIRGFHANENFL